MGTKAYFMVNVAEGTCKNGYQDVLRDLISIPEVQSVERLDGIFDLMVEVENPVTMGFVGNTILTKEWVKRLQVLKVEPAELVEVARPSEPEVTKVPS